MAGVLTIVARVAGYQHLSLVLIIEKIKTLVLVQIVLYGVEQPKLFTGEELGATFV